MSTAIVSAVVRFGRYCEEDIDGTLSCSNLGWNGFLAVIGLLGIAMYITVGCVWAQRRSNAKPRLTSTVASACILSIPMMAGVVALLLELQSYNSFGLTSDNHLFLIICAVVLGSVVIVTGPVSFSLLPMQTATASRWHGPSLNQCAANTRAHRRNHAVLCHSCDLQPPRIHAAAHPDVCPRHTRGGVGVAGMFLAICRTYRPATCTEASLGLPHGVIILV